MEFGAGATAAVVVTPSAEVEEAAVTAASGAWSMGGGSSLLLQLLFVVCAAVGVVLMVRLTLRGPGYVPQGSTRARAELAAELRRLAEARKLDVAGFCCACAAPRPERSRHCTRCGRCVVRFDHHCAWINNCVGSSNHPEFLAFVALLMTVQALYVYFVGCYVARQPRVEPAPVWLAASTAESRGLGDSAYWLASTAREFVLRAAACAPWHALQALWCAMHLSWESALLVSQVNNNLRHGITTYEVARERAQRGARAGMRYSERADSFWAGHRRPAPSAADYDDDHEEAYYDSLNHGLLANLRSFCHANAPHDWRLGTFRR